MLATRLLALVAIMGLAAAYDPTGEAVELQEAEGQESFAEQQLREAKIQVHKAAAKVMTLEEEEKQALTDEKESRMEMNLAAHKAARQMDKTKQATDAAYQKEMKAKKTEARAKTLEWLAEEEAKTLDQVQNMYEEAIATKEEATNKAQRTDEEKTAVLSALKQAREVSMLKRDKKALKSVQAEHLAMEEADETDAEAGSHALANWRWRVGEESKALNHATEIMSQANAAFRQTLHAHDVVEDSRIKLNAHNRAAEQLRFKLLRA